MCLIVCSLPLLKSHTYCPPRHLSSSFSKLYPRCCLPGCSPHVAPRKTRNSYCAFILVDQVLLPTSLLFSPEQTPPLPSSPLFLQPPAQAPTGPLWATLAASAPHLAFPSPPRTQRRRAPNTDRTARNRLFFSLARGRL